MRVAANLHTTEFVDTQAIDTRGLSPEEEEKGKRASIVPVKACHVRTCGLDTALPLVGGLMPSRHVVCMS